MSKQEPRRSAKVKPVRGGQGKRAAGMARFGPANSAYGVPAEHLTELARDIDSLIKVLHGSESPPANKARAMISRLAEDARYSAARPAFRAMQAHIRARRPEDAREIAVEVFNVAWDRSQEYWVGKDAFIRRIRGKDFKPLSHADPLTSDRAAALAWIMQADKAALEAIGCGPARSTGLVIELSGDFETIRLIKD